MKSINITGYFLRLGVYADCNQSCLMCNPLGIRNNNPNEILSDTDLIEIFKAASSIGIQSSHLTGGEPFIRSNLMNILREAYSGKERIMATTNGTLLYKYNRDLRGVGFKRLNVSVHSLDPKKHSELTRTTRESFYKKIEGVKEASANLDLVKLNVVVMREINLDEIDAFIDFCQENGIVLRLMELVPYSITSQPKFFARNFVSRGEMKAILSRRFKRMESTAVEGNNWACEYFRLDELPVPMGIDYHYSSGYFCPGAVCKGIRISPSGLISACWTKTGEYAPKGSLKGLHFEEKRQLIQDSLEEKMALEQGKLNYPRYHIPNYTLFRGNIKKEN